MAVSFNPFMASFSLTDTVNPVSIQALLATLSANNKPSWLANPSGVGRCQMIRVISDIANGGALLYVGNSNMTTSYYGKKLAATQEAEIYAGDSNLIRLDQVFVLPDTNPTVVSLIIVTR